MTTTERSDETARLLELYVAKWLRESDIGMSVLETFTFDEAIDHIFELLNAGFLKLTGTADEITGIKLCNPPRPPMQPIYRPKQAVQ